MKEILKYIFDKENLKANGLVVIIILLIFLVGGTSYVLHKVLTNDLHDRKEEKRDYIQATILQATSNEKVASAINNLGSIIERVDKRLPPVSSDLGR